MKAVEVWKNGRNRKYLLKSQQSRNWNFNFLKSKVYTKFAL